MKSGIPAYQLLLAAVNGQKLTPVRSLNVDSRSGQWTVSYRYGVLNVEEPRRIDGTGSAPLKHLALVDMGNSAVPNLDAISVAQRGMSGVHIQSLTISGNSPLASLTQSQRHEANRAATIARKAIALRQQGEITKAIPLAEEAREICRDALGTDHPHYGLSLVNLARLYDATGNYAKAEPIHLEARERLRHILGTDHPHYAVCLNNLAALYLAKNDYAKAEPLYLEAFDIIKEVFGVDHSDHPRSLNGLAHFYTSKGEYAKAESLYLEAHDIWKRVCGPKHPNHAQSLSNLGLLYSFKGDHAKAESLLLEACELRKRVLGSEHPDYAESLHNLASLYHSTGDYTKAEALCLEALNIRQRVLGQKHPHYAVTLNLLARLYKSMGDLAKAEVFYTRALEVFKRELGTQSHGYAINLHSLALLHRAKGDYAKAEALHLEAHSVLKQIMGTEHPDYAESLNNLALFYHQMREFAKSKSLYIEAGEILKRKLGTQDPLYVGNLNNLSALYCSMGDFARAEPLFVKARHIDKEVLGPEHPHYGRSLNNLAELYFSLGDDLRAKPLSLEARDVLLRASAKALPQLSEAQALSFLDLNRPRVDLLLAILRRSPVSNASEAYESVWRTKALGTRFRLNQRIDADASPEVQRVFDELREARLTLAWLVSSVSSHDHTRVLRTELANASERKEILEKKLATIHSASGRAIAIRDASINELLSQLPDDVVVIDFAQILNLELVELPIEMERDQQKEKRVVPNHRALPHYDAFVIGRRGDGNQRIDWISLGPAEPIDEAVAAWRKHLISYVATTHNLPSLAVRSEAAGSERPMAETPQRQLRKLIWEPLQEHLAEGQTVIVIPDGALTKVPWGAIPGHKENSYLIEEYAIATASYGQQLFGLLSADPVSDGPLLAVGGIDYDHRQTPKAQPPKNPSENIQLAVTSRRRSAERASDQQCEFLPGAKAESQQVVDRWASAQENPLHRLLSGTDADEANLTELLPQSRYVHLATHGFFAAPEVKSLWQFDIRQEGLFGSDRHMSGRATVAARNPLLLSGIVVAGANLPPECDALGLTTGEDGILTAEELASLNLYNTELITLSACETGLGEVAAGEGVFGLQRALHQAGARSVISSLWKVDDLATQALMTEFYHNLWHKKLGKLESLRQAQLSMLQNYDSPSGTIRGLGTQSVPVPVRQAGGKQLSPYYWAAFQLSGDWR